MRSHLSAIANIAGTAGIAICCAGLAGGPAAAQLNLGLPGQLEGVGITQKLDQNIPLDLEFRDEMGKPVRLEQFFAEGQPVLMSLGYYRCPMLCDLVLNGMIDALKEIDWVPGREFRIVTVSIDPSETAELGRLKKQNYLRSYRRPGADKGWHFLTGSEESIRKLADAVGFEYRYLEDRKEYAHSAALYVLTPQGRISRYLFGIKHDPTTLRLSLVEASEGRIGSVVDQFLLYCFRYDAVQGRYTPMAWKVMRIGGALTALLLGSLLISYWRRETRLKKRLV